MQATVTKFNLATNALQPVHSSDGSVEVDKTSSSCVTLLDILYPIVFSMDLKNEADSHTE